MRYWIFRRLYGLYTLWRVDHNDTGKNVCNESDDHPTLSRLNPASGLQMCLSTAEGGYASGIMVTS